MDMIKCELMKLKIGQVVFDSRPKRDKSRLALEVVRAGCSNNQMSDLDL